MRITILNQFYRPNIAPTAHLAASLAEDRAERGDQVTVITSTGGYVAPDVQRHEKTKRTNPRVVRTWTPMLGKKTVLHRCIDYLSYYLLAMLRVLFLPRQELIVSLTTPPYIAWVAILHRLFHRKCKIVLWNMDCYPELAEQAGKLKKGGFLSRIMRWGNRAMFRRIDHLIVLDTAMRDLLMSQYAPCPDQPPTTTIPNWEDASFFPVGKTYEPWEGIDRLGLKDRLVVLYLGNMGQGHEFDQVVEAANQLRNDPIVFLFIGGGARTAEIVKAKEQLSLDNIIVHPYVPKDMTGSVMSAADCALITLRPWALGIMSPSKLHANLALGLPVLYVGPETSNVDDAIKHYDCGISLRREQINEIVTFLRVLIQKPEEQQRLSQNARIAFDAAYNDQKVIPHFDEVFSQLFDPTHQ